MTDAISGDQSQDQADLAILRISHELRTPLTVVIGFCELLQDDRQADSSVKEFASRIAENAWLLHSAVERLINELHNPDFTSLMASNQIQREDGAGGQRLGSLFPFDAQSPTEIERQTHERIEGDNLRPTEHTG